MLLLDALRNFFWQKVWLKRKGIETGILFCCCRDGMTKKKRILSWISLKKIFCRFKTPCILDFYLNYCVYTVVANLRTL